MHRTRKEHSNPRSRKSGETSVVGFFVISDCCMYQMYFQWLFLSLMVIKWKPRVGKKSKEVIQHMH